MERFEIKLLGSLVAASQSPSKLRLKSAPRKLPLGSIPQGGYSAICQASSRGDMDQIQLLLDSGATIDPDKDIIVAMAAHGAPLEVVRLLLDLGASADSKEPVGFG